MLDVARRKLLYLLRDRLHRGANTAPPRRQTATVNSSLSHGTTKSWCQNWRQTPNVKQPRQTKHLTGLSFTGARDWIRTGIPFEVFDLSYSLSAHRRQLPLKLATVANVRLSVWRPARPDQSHEYRPERNNPARQNLTGLMFTWSTRPDSNRRPSRWQRDALPAELLVPECLAGTEVLRKPGCAVKTAWPIPRPGGEKSQGGASRSIAAPRR
jgi:hypothetical protein